MFHIEYKRASEKEQIKSIEAYKYLMKDISMKNKTETDTMRKMSIRRRFGH